MAIRRFYKKGCNPGKQVPKQFFVLCFFDSLEHTNDGLGCRTNGCGAKFKEKEQDILEYIYNASLHEFEYELELGGE